MDDMTDPAARLIDVLTLICDELPRRQQYLCDLDAPVGDGDHGVTMSRCCGVILDQLPAQPGSSVSAVLEAVGTALVSSGGGATGPLLGSAFIEAGRVAGQSPDDTPRVSTLLEASLRGMEAVGGARVGDRTLLDALHPAVEAARRAEADRADLAGVLAASAGAAEHGAQATAEMVPRVGRSVRFGERAIGHPDPGAVSVAMMLRTAADWARADKEMGSSTEGHD
jgi:phosphoenolpyruvate---glycerone phosphotransferase subunit DhaL